MRAEEEERILRLRMWAKDVGKNKREKNKLYLVERKCPFYEGWTLHLLEREMSLHSGGRTRMVSLPAELGWISNN